MRRLRDKMREDLELRGMSAEVGDVLESAVGRIVKQLRRGGLLASLDGDASDESEMDGLTALIALAASGRRSP